MATLSGAPNVFDNEFDLSQIIPQVASTEAAFVGQFRWGPLDVKRLIGSESQLYSEYLGPVSNNFRDWFCAANFLAYSNQLWLVRVADTTSNVKAVNATCDVPQGFLVKNEEHYFENYEDGSLDSIYNVGPWIARYPGSIGNSLKVSSCTSDSAFSSTLAGTVTVALGNTIVTGVGTSFNTALRSDDTLYIDKTTYRIKSITNSTSIVLQDRIKKTANNVQAKRFWGYSNEFDLPPKSTKSVLDKNGSGDAMHVIVIDEDGLFTGRKGTILEKFEEVSMAFDAKTPEGENNYYKHVINQKSKYIYWASHGDGLSSGGANSADTIFVTLPNPVSYSLIGGNGTTPTEADYIKGYDIFADKETSEISMIITGAATPVVCQYIIDNICETRRDCVAVLSPPLNTVLNNFGDEAEDIVAYRDTLSSTSYGIIDSGYKYQYDKYNDLYRWIPLNPDVAGLMARTDQDRDPWWSPAGFNRGQIKNVVKLAYNPKEPDRDLLYKNGVNSIVTFPSEGTILYGDKTMQEKTSAFDRINVRRLFIVLRKAISRAAKYTLFELNDDFTRATFRNMVNPYLRDIAGRRGIYDFKVVCDSTNNTPEVIDRNEFVANILIKPAKSINYITLNFVATRTGLNFEEVPPNIF